MDPVPGDGGVPLDLPADVVAFYSIGDWEASGELASVVRGFLSVFDADDPVVLVVKPTTTTQDTTPIMLELGRLVGAQLRPAQVQFEPHEWARERFSGLHCRGDCYLTSGTTNADSHALDAAAYGNPVVSANDAERLRTVAADPLAARLLVAPRVRPASTTPATQQPIPRIAHFVFGLSEHPEPFHLVHELAIRSCLEVVDPDEVYLHCHYPPYGPAWERVARHVMIRPVEPVDAVSGFRYPDPYVGQFAYAHHADFVRLDALAEHGGLYADLDTLFVAPIPDDLWHRPFVIGREADVLDGCDPVPRPALSNALLMSTADSPFLAAWRSEIGASFDGGWATHSCFLAHDLARRMPSEVHVEPQTSFHAFEPTVAGFALLLEHPPPRLHGVVSMHLAAHLWWSEHRVDFSPVHSGMIDADWVRSSPSTYAVHARRFLTEGN